MKCRCGSMVEQMFCKHQVGGSIPSTGSKNLGECAERQRQLTVNQSSESSSGVRVPPLPPQFKYAGITQRLEYLTFNENVGGSNPSARTRIKMVDIAQLDRALGCGPRGRGFESHYSPQYDRGDCQRGQGIGLKSRQSGFDSLSPHQRFVISGLVGDRSE